MTVQAESELGQVAIAHRRIERWLMRFMVVGLLAMFQPWFRNVAGWFDGLTDSGDASLVYRQDIAPVVFRYGFFLLLVSTLGFIIVGHYTPLMLQRALTAKGKALTFWLIFLPLAYGVMLITSLAYGYGGGLVVGIVGAVAAIAAWNWRIWGVVLIVLMGIVAIATFATGGFTWLGAVLGAGFAAVTVFLVLPHWHQFQSAELGGESIS